MSAANRACFEDWQQQLTHDPDYLAWVQLYDKETRKLKEQENGNNSESKARRL